ncbi:MAG: hypothetical protein IAG13_36055 [Deltaproteobacteria bacterium]|nr:hypothetical protein [Nannocystaceae bacterium]
MGFDIGSLAELSVVGDYLRVALHRTMADLAESKRLQTEVIERAAAAGVVKVLFDYSRVGSHADDVRSDMWQWAGRTKFVAMALVVDSDLTRIRMNMTAVAQRVRMRAFLSDRDALGWLDGAEKRRPTTEIPKL